MDRTVFDAYLNSGQISSGFMEEVNEMISRVYAGWSLFEDEEEFNSSCWTKIVVALEIYTKEESYLSTYLYQVIWNEAQRIYSKHKRMSFDDISKLTNPERTWYQTSSSTDDLMVRDRVCTFAQKAFKMGVYVNQQGLYRNYVLAHLTPAVKAFMWDSILASRGGSAWT